MDDERIVQIVPADGWRVEYEFDDGAKCSEPLVGWGLRADGEIVPLDTDIQGIVMDVTELAGKWRIYHPDAREEA